MKLLVQENKIYIVSQHKIEDKLSNRNYLLNWDDKGNCWLEEYPEFKFRKLYEKDKDFRARVLKKL